MACHNAALLNVKLGRWADAQELVDEGIEFTKAGAALVAAIVAAIVTTVVPLACDKTHSSNY